MALAYRPIVSSRSAFINGRSDFGIGRARPSLMKATRTSAFDKQLLAAPHLLRQRDRGALHRDRPCHDVEHIIHPRRPQESKLHRAHHEGKARRFRLRLLEQRMLLGAHQPQMIGAPALHEAQIIGVIDDAGKIRVLVIDADLHVMAAVADFAVEMKESSLSSSTPPPPRKLDRLEMQLFCANPPSSSNIARPNVSGYATAGRGEPIVTSTISGGTPSRNGMMLQPRPPETTTSQFIRIWP